MKTYRQSGSAHVIIIVVLVIAVIGLLGFVFWQNFIQDDKQSQVKNSTASTNDDNSVNKKLNNNTVETDLVIEEWGIGIPGAAKFTAVSSNQSDGSGTYTVYKVSTTEISKEALALKCTDDKLGSIVKVQASDVQDGNPASLVSQKIGDYYYFYTPRSQAACVGGDGMAPEKLNSLMDEANKEFPALFVKTTSHS